MSLVVLIVPPIYKNIVICARVANLPVELRRNVVYIALLCPSRHICKELIVVREGICLAAIGIIFFVFMYAKWTYAKAEIWFYALYGIIYSLNEHLYIMPAPVCLLPILKALALCILSKGLIVVILLKFLRIWVEVVVKMEGIYIIPCGNVCHNLYGMLYGSRLSRIEIELLAITAEDIGILIEEMIFAKHLFVA